jgi:transcriptional regulator with XRE-family HTH domain
MQESRIVPEWTCGDRMRKAREHAGLKQSDLSPAAGISRTSAVAYESGQSLPGRKVLITWAMVTGVPVEWLCHGDTAPCGAPFPAVRPRERGLTGQQEYFMQKMPTRVAS